MTDQTAAGSLEEGLHPIRRKTVQRRLKETLEVFLQAPVGEKRLRRFSQALAARNLKIVEMKDGE